MYDKLKLFIPLLDGVSVVGGCLDEAKEQTNLNTGEVCIFGGLGGLKVSVYPNGLYFTGSLAKFLYPGNIYPLDRHSTAEAVEKLSDALHVDVGAARVTSLEFGTHFIMKHPVGAYLSRLGDMPRLMRLPTGADTLYYRAKGKHPAKKLCFYDKVAEAKVKGETVPGVFDGANLLRYEMRLDGRLPQQLGVPAVQASTLYESDFYRMLVRKWQAYYFSISKNNLKTSSI